MTVLLGIEIAGICFEVYGNRRITLENLDAAYSPFVMKDAGAGSRPADMRICLEAGCPETDGLTQIFDSGQSWSMFSGDGHRFISLHPPVFDTPLWIAKMNEGFSKAVYFYSREPVTEKNGRAQISNPVSYPLGQILLMYILARKNGALLHAAGAGINGRGLVFPGISGAGKSTICRRFLSRGDLELLSDDRVAIRKMGGAFHAFGTPWPGEAGIAENRHLPLAGIFFLRQSRTDNIKAITPREALERLLPVTSVPWYDREILPDSLRFCGDLIAQVPAYELEFKDSKAVVDVLEEFVSA